VAAADSLALTEPQIRRYSRHVLLPDVGGVGQARLLAATVTLDLATDTAAAIAAVTYLAAAGGGHLVLLGADRPVTADDIQHGIALGVADLDQPLFTAMSARLTALNPDVRISDTPPASPLPLGAGDGPLVRGGLAAARAVHAIATGAP